MQWLSVNSALQFTETQGLILNGIGRHRFGETPMPMWVYSSIPALHGVLRSVDCVSACLITNADFYDPLSLRWSAIPIINPRYVHRYIP